MASTRIAILMVLVIASCKAFEVNELVGTRYLNDDTDDGLTEDGEERFLFTSSTTVTVNSTLIRALGAIIGSLLLALPLYLAYASHKGGGGYGYGYDEYGYGRKKREDPHEQDWLTSLHLLVESLKKFHVDDLNCQLWVACEAGKRQYSDKTSELFQTVHKILRRPPLRLVKNHEASQETEFADQMLSAFRKGLVKESDCNKSFEKCSKKSSILG